MLNVQNSLFGSKSLIWKSDREQFTHVALYKRWTVSESLSLLIKKEQCEWFACDSSKSLAKNERFTQKICLFRMFETSVPLFNAQEWITHVALCSFALVSTWVICSRRSLQKSNLSNSLRSLITKERLWAIRSRHSLKKSKSAICSQKWANRTFDIRLKNRWANSQPCLYTYF